MQIPLMPQATAVWLIDNTSLTFKQIADFCNLHILEVSRIADGDLSKGVKGRNPITNGHLSYEEIKRCEISITSNLKFREDCQELKSQLEKNNLTKLYIPIKRRKHIPSAILWLTKNFPELSNLNISKLLTITTSFVKKIRNSSYSSRSTIIPKDPVWLLLCSQRSLDRIVLQAKNAVNKNRKYGK